MLIGQEVIHEPPYSFPYNYEVPLILLVDLKLWFIQMQEWKSCSVGCKFGFSGDKKPDAAFGLPQPSGTATVLRSMESAEYYAENNIAMARRWVSTVGK